MMCIYYLVLPTGEQCLSSEHRFGKLVVFPKVVKVLYWFCTFTHAKQILSVITLSHNGMLSVFLTSSHILLQMEYHLVSQIIHPNY